MNSDALNTLLTPLTADEAEDVTTEPTRNDRQVASAFADLTRSRVEVSLDLLAGTIVTRSYPDQLLPPQDVLAAEFGVSRTVLREAISRLLARNMVEVRPKSGTRIVDARQWRVIDQEVGISRKFDVALGLEYIAGIPSKALAKLPKTQQAQMRNLYVAMSRPTSLLCLAANESRVPQKVCDALAKKGWQIQTVA